MNFKTLTITVVIAASLAALASMPLTAPAEAGGNVKVSNKNHQHHNGDITGDNNQNQECVGIDITGSCIDEAPGGGGTDPEDPQLCKDGTPPPCNKKP